MMGIDKRTTDDELVENAGDKDSAVMFSVEMMRRLKDSIDKFDRNTEKYSKILTALTIILVILGVFQFVISIVPDNYKIYAGLVYLGILAWFIYKLVRHKIL